MHHRRSFIIIFFFVNTTIAASTSCTKNDIFETCICTKAEAGDTTVANVDCTFRRLNYLTIKRRNSETDFTNRHIKRHQNAMFPSESISFDFRHNILLKLSDEFGQISTYTAYLTKEIYLSYNRLRHVNSDSFANLQNLQVLYLDHNQLLFIPNLHDLPHLQELDLSYNIAINKLSATLLPISLKKLAVAGVGIKHITSSSFTGLTNLVFLDMSDGIGTGIRNRKIDTLVFDTVQNLTSLDISYTSWSNNITSERLWQSLTNLESLTARRCYLKKPLILYNKSTEVPFSHKLVTLDMSGNRFNITNLTKIRFDKLERLYLNNTRLTSVPQNAFQNMPKLIELHISGVSLPDGNSINLQTIPSLRHVDISFNRLKNISILPQNVKILNVFGNNLKTITRRVFSNIQNVVTLNLTGQGIFNIEDLAFYKQNQTTPNLLRYLCLNKNQLKSIRALSFHGLTSLTELYLQDNHLEEITGVLPLPSVEKLAMSNNDFVQLSFSIFTNMINLQILDLSKNEALTELELNTTMNELMELNLNNCNLTLIPNMSMLPQLHTLKLSNNIIDYITLADFSNCCENLHTLILDKNLIEILSEPVFATLLNLKYLDLSENSPSISNKAFKNLTNLVTLKLRNNGMDRFLMFPLPSLEVLDMAQNNLTSLGVTPIGELFPSIRQINLNGNYISYIKNGTLDGMENLTLIDFQYNEFQCPCNESTKEFQTYLYVKQWLNNFAQTEQADPKMDIKSNINLFTYYCARHSKHDVINLFDEFSCDPLEFNPFDKLLFPTDNPSYYDYYG